jgi:hypothetical protein
MYRCPHPETFTQRIKELNRKAVAEIANCSYDSAIVYLGEAERNLEYAANCGMSIDRILITTTLKNMGCGCQRRGDLSACYTYIEALIFNLSVPSDPKAENLKDGGYDKLAKAANTKLKLAISYLQLSALSSELGKHMEANNMAKQSLAEFQALADICYSCELLIRGKTSALLDSIRSSL